MIISRYVHLLHPQSQIATRRPPPRILSRKRQSEKSHPRQSLPLESRSDRGSPSRPAWRFRSCRTLRGCAGPHLRHALCSKTNRRWPWDFWRVRQLASGQAGFIFDPGPRSASGLPFVGGALGRRTTPSAKFSVWVRSTKTISTRRWTIFVPARRRLNKHCSGCTCAGKPHRRDCFSTM